jgi:hypothetical protein
VRIQLWSYNHDPEPTGIGIVSTVWARGLRDRSHQVEVVAESRLYTDKWSNAPAGRERVRGTSRACARTEPRTACTSRSDESQFTGDRRR